MSKKIDLFRDKEYEELNWLNRAVEPFIFSLNDVMAKVPDEMMIGYDDLVAFIGSHYSMSFDKEFILDKLLKREGVAADPEDIKEIAKHVEITWAGTPSVNFISKNMSEPLVVRKTKSQLDDEDIKKFIAENVRGLLWNMKGDNIGRLNEVMDLINCTDKRDSRSERYKKGAIAKCLSLIFEEDKWRIRDVNLAIKSAVWIKDYVESGNLASLSNVTRLKCMTHKGISIYSMEETV